MKAKFVSNTAEVQEGMQAVATLGAQLLMQGSLFNLACSCPLTRASCVKRTYTDLAVIDVSVDGFQGVDMLEGLRPDPLHELTGTLSRTAWPPKGLHQNPLAISQPCHAVPLPSQPCAQEA